MTTNSDLRPSAADTLAQAAQALLARDPTFRDVYGLRPEDAADDASLLSAAICPSSLRRKPGCPADHLTPTEAPAKR